MLGEPTGTVFDQWALLILTPAAWAARLLKLRMPKLLTGAADPDEPDRLFQPRTTPFA